MAKAGWGAYLTGKPYTPPTTIRHPAHFDYVPTSGADDACMREEPSAEEVARCAAKRKPAAAGDVGAGAGGTADGGAGSSCKRRSSCAEDAMTD